MASVQLLLQMNVLHRQRLWSNTICQSRGTGYCNSRIDRLYLLNLLLLRLITQNFFKCLELICHSGTERRLRMNTAGRVVRIIVILAWNDCIRWHYLRC
mmetsp:Transcript_7995/g.22832  ORF Transcript_7995/g.22832 Transcript_7995/m.22832 type:complete len:99 (-) Transcript_7995:583-879(-)